MWFSHYKLVRLLELHHPAGLEFKIAVEQVIQDTSMQKAPMSSPSS
jgi:hypothetical protein